MKVLVVYMVDYEEPDALVVEAESVAAVQEVLGAAGHYVSHANGVDDLPTLTLAGLASKFEVSEESLCRYRERKAAQREAERRTAWRQTDAGRAVLRLLTEHNGTDNPMASWSPVAPHDNISKVERSCSKCAALREQARAADPSWREDLALARERSGSRRALIDALEREFMKETPDERRKRLPAHGGWVGVDFDGTLATYNGWKGPGALGAPIPKMVERVKRWLVMGVNVVVFTARASGPDGGAQCEVISRWTLEHIGHSLPVTCQKDHKMIELWDDRAVQVVTNTGERADGLP